jgi:cytochrome c
MCKLVGFLVAVSCFGQGRPASAELIQKLDITVFADGRGLPVGKGTAAAGRAIYKSKCAVCHNDNGEGREKQYPALIGGIGTLATERPVKRVGSFWPYATTVFDYIRRSMPFDHPRTLTADEVYAVTAFLLHLNGLVAEDLVLDEKNLAGVKMPNRDGFVPDQRPDVKAKR